MSELLLLIVLFFAGIAAGISNAIAGGGTFFTFPVFLAAGVPPVVANASNAIAVWPGHAMAVVGYRNVFKSVPSGLRLSILLVFLGGVFGAYLLTIIDNSSFTKLIPFLILFATFLFAYGKQIIGWLKKRITVSSSANSYIIRSSELAFATYGGFFGAGYGVMLMALLQMANDNDLHTNNALKNLIATIVSSVAVAVFIFSGVVSWEHTCVAFAGAVLGGLVGTKVARWLSAVWLSRVVIAFGLFLGGYYFLKYYS